MLAKNVVALGARTYVFRTRDGLPAPLETDDIRRVTHNWVEYGGRMMDSHAKSRRYEELDLSTLAPDPDRTVFNPGLLMEVGSQLVARSTRQLGKGRRRERQIYPLSSLIYYAHCEQLAAKDNNRSLRTRLIGGSKQQKYYVHRAGIRCGRVRGQVPRHFLETEFLGLVRLLAADADLMNGVLRLSADTQVAYEGDADIEARLNAAIAKCKRRIEAAKHLYADGDIPLETVAGSVSHIARGDG